MALERDSGGAVAFGRMRQPLPTMQPFEPQAALLQALGLASSRLPIEGYLNGPHNVYVALEDDAAVASLAPDLGAVAALGAFNVSCFAGAGSNWKTRMFAPAIGVAEDPATGSPPGRSRCTWRDTARSSLGQEIEIAQGARSGGRRSCTHGSRAQASRSS